MDREALGQMVRAAWVKYCRETGDDKPSHLAPWESLSEWDREADRRIGEALTARLTAERDSERAARVLSQRWSALLYWLCSEADMVLDDLPPMAHLPTRRQWNETRAHLRRAVTEYRETYGASPPPSDEDRAEIARLHTDFAVHLAWFANQMEVTDGNTVPVATTVYNHLVRMARQMAALPARGPERPDQAPRPSDGPLDATTGIPERPAGNAEPPAG